MSAQAIFDVVTATLRKNAGFELADCELGAEWTDTSGAPPRIVWVPGEDDFEGDPKGGTNPTAICEAQEGFTAHVWGVDYDGTRALRDLFIRALHKHCIGSYRLRRGVWVPSNAGLVRSGRLYLLSFSVLVPVTKPARSTTTPGGVRINPQVTP